MPVGTRLISMSSAGITLPAVGAATDTKWFASIRASSVRRARRRDVVHARP